MLLSQLNTNRFRLKALKLINNSQGNQKGKTIESGSTCEQILFRVSQGNTFFVQHIFR